MGVPNKTDKPVSGRATVVAIVMTSLHLALWIGLFMLTLRVVPQYERLLEDFDAELPMVTRLVIQFSQSVISYWFLYLAAGVIALGLDFVFLRLVGNASRIAQVAVGVVLALVPLLLAVLVLLSVSLPLGDLIQDLS